jgi:hypothetical protein
MKNQSGIEQVSEKRLPGILLYEAIHDGIDFFEKEIKEYGGAVKRIFFSPGK